MCLQINANSGIANNEHLMYFHFAGRLLGKALFDGQIVPSHLVSPLYKVGAVRMTTFSRQQHIYGSKVFLMLKKYVFSLSLIFTYVVVHSCYWVGQ